MIIKVRGRDVKRWGGGSVRNGEEGELGMGRRSLKDKYRVVGRRFGEEKRLMTKEKKVNRCIPEHIISTVESSVFISKNREFQDLTERRGLVAEQAR